jgi:hypothetical protein
MDQAECRALRYLDPLDDGSVARPNPGGERPREAFDGAVREPGVVPHGIPDERRSVRCFIETIAVSAPAERRGGVVGAAGELGVQHPRFQLAEKILIGGIRPGDEAQLHRRVTAPVSLRMEDLLG